MRKAAAVLSALALFGALAEAGGRSYTRARSPRPPAYRPVRKTAAPRVASSPTPRERTHAAAARSSQPTPVARSPIVRSPIMRSGGARVAFRQANPCPSTGKTFGPCPGWVIDHIVPLKRGGADLPSNMQWQTEAAARAKDRIE